MEWVKSRAYQAEYDILSWLGGEARQMVLLNIYRCETLWHELRFPCSYHRDIATRNP